MFQIDQLKDKLREVEVITNSEWMAGLNERKRKELEFHDLDRDRSRIESLDRDTYEKFYGNRKYYDATQLSKAYVDRWIEKHAKNRVFLDYACGNGANAIKAAKAGARLAIGIDISSMSIENAKADAEKEGVKDNTYFVQADAENTRLPDNAIDTVICSGMLHHLDLSCAFPELERILALKGRILAVEALNYNPIIRLYRHLTPEMRTDWEKRHILGLADVRLGGKFFHIGEIRYWHITSILSPHVKPLAPVFDYVDRILTRVPFLRLLAWIFTFELMKR